MAQEEGVGLRLPPQAKPDKESFDIRARKVSEWLENLPVGNVGETTRLLYQALHDVNRHQHNWKDRYRFLEAIRDPLHAVQQAISKRYTGQSLPLPAKTQQIAVLSQRLSIEMAIGYKAACDEMLKSNVLFQDRAALRIMLHRVLRYLSQSILTAYQIYSQQQSGLWLELHRLYSFAEKHSLHKASVVDRLCQGLPESSIARIYKQIALLAAASPFRLRQGEATAVYAALARWSAHAELLPYDAPSTVGALFVIHLNSDEEPDYRAFDQSPCESNSCVLLDTRQMLKILESEGKQVSNAPTAVLTADLIDRLIQSWGSGPKRGEDRIEGKQNMSVVAGMTRIHQHLAPALHDSVMEPHISVFESQMPRSFQKQSSANDVWNLYASKAGSASKPAQKTAPAKTQEQPPAEEVQTWHVRNESPGGYCFLVPEHLSGSARVGELVVIRSEGTLDRWQPAVVRWLRSLSSQGVEAGLQVIAPQMIVIMVKNLTPGKDKGEPQRGLLLPAVTELGQQATLILPNRMFVAGDRVLLHTSDNEIEVVLENMLQDSGIFVQFEFNAVEHDKQQQPELERTESAGNPFDDLWKQL